MFYYYIEPSELYIGPNEIYGVLVNSNSENLYLRFKISMYEGCILRTIIDDVKTDNHKRFRTSSALGFQYETLQP